MSSTTVDAKLQHTAEKRDEEKCAVREKKEIGKMFSVKFLNNGTVIQ